MNNERIVRSSERGSAGVKFMIFLAVVILVGNAGFNYVPVRYQAESMKTEMATAVLQGLAMPGKMSPLDNVKARVQRAAQANDIPPDALIAVTQVAGNSIQAHVAYEKDVSVLPFGIYKYHFKFDHTATPTGFLLKE